MKNILILISKGPQYRPLFRNIGSFLIEKGYNVYYVLESHYTDYEYDKGSPIAGAYYFSDFLNNKNRTNRYNIQEKYANINLYECLITEYDRFVKHYNLWGKKEKEKQIDTLASLVFFYEEIIEKNNIDTILHECAANEFAYVAYLVGKKNGLIYIGLQASRLPGRMEIHDGPHGPVLNKKSSIILSDEDKKAVEKYITGVKDITPFYMNSKFNPANTLYIKEYSSIKKIRKILNLIRYRIKFNSTIHNEFGSEKPIGISYALFKRQLIRFLKIKQVNKLYEIPKEGEVFYIYPVHFEPEASVSVWAKYYIDQANFIKNIAFQLPFGSFLYVKDHKSSRGLLTKQFYKEIKLIPNVRFISPDINSKELVLKSKGVITLTSTLGLEALAMRKRVYIFGDIFFENHPFAVKIPHYRNLFENLISDCKNEPQYDEKYDEFFYRYYMSTYPGTFDVFNPDKDLTENIYNAIVKYAKY